MVQGPARILLCLAAALSAGCDGRGEWASAPPVAASASAPAAVEDEQPFFVGRWAAREDLCAEGAWVFTESGVTTAGEVSCRFDSVRRVTAGYDIAATCWAEGAPTPHTIQLSYAESAQALLVEGGPFADIGLIACPASE